MSGTYERELINAFDTLDIPSMRAPSSGSSTSRELPDILASWSIGVEDICNQIQQSTGLREDEGPLEAAKSLAPLSKPYGIEHKAQQGTTLYVDADEVEKLIKFCESFGARPRLGARFREQRHPVDHFLVHPDDARTTDTGRYGLPVEDIESRASEIITPDSDSRDATIKIL